MSNITFVYCFSKKLSANEEQYAVILELLGESINLLSQQFNYKIITDEYTYDDVSKFTDNIEIVDTDSFVFTDDFKVYLLPKLLENEIIVDPDIFIKRKLDISLHPSLIFDYKDSPNNDWYTENLDKLKGTALYSRIKSAGEIPFVPNIGFFKMDNLELRREFCEDYYEYRSEIVEKFKDDPNQFNLLLCQYLLGVFLHEKKYPYFSVRSVNTGKVYVHLAGPQKYEKLNRQKLVI